MKDISEIVATFLANNQRKQKVKTNHNTFSVVSKPGERQGAQQRPYASAVAPILLYYVYCVRGIFIDLSFDSYSKTSIQRNVFN